MSYLTKERRAKAVAGIKKYAPVIGETGMLKVAHGLKWYDCLIYNEDGKLTIQELNEIQFVALAAAMAAYADGMQQGRNGDA